MKDNEFKERLNRLMDERKDAPLTERDIAAALHLKGKDRKRLQHWMRELVVNGELVCIRKNGYARGAEADLVTGTLALVRSGNGFVGGAGQPDVFVSSQDIGVSLPGDRVVVRLSSDRASDRRGLRTGKVIRILERTQRDIVGTLKTTGKFLYVVPVDPVYHKDFYVPDAGGAAINDRVVIRFSDWQNKHVSPEAEVIEVLGPADEPSVDTISIIRHFGLKQEFSPEVIREAETASRLAERPGVRLDLRDRFIVTIDPERARDFDDALSMETDEQGRRVLGVHIADVGHFVRENSALDREARTRGNSVYLPDKVLPMLPEQLSNGVCSLRPDEDRLTFSAFLTMDDAGKVVARRFARTIIRSQHRLTYEQAMSLILRGEASEKPAGKRKSEPGGEGKRQAIIADPEAERQVEALLGRLNHLAQQMRQKRFARYAMDLDMPECEVQIGPDGRMTGIRVVENDRSHQLVEECMVAANEAVASEISGRGLPVIFRIHEPPREEKIEELTVQLIGMGYAPGNLRDAHNLALFLKSVEGDPLAYDVKVAILRSMNRALYSVEAMGHFGLAKKFYAHFTSPIRRYPDLVLHRQLAAMLAPARDAQAGRVMSAPTRLYSKEEIVSVADHCSRTEQTAEEAERALLEIKKYRFLAQQLAEKKPMSHEAVVVNVMNFGLFVELLDLRVQGLVHVSAISDKFVTYQQKKGTLQAGRVVYRRGQKVQVRTVKVDFDNRKVDFTLVK